MLSDTVLVAIVTGVPATIAAFASLITAGAVLVQRGTIKKLETNTNSIKDALVKVTGDEAYLRGKADLRSEESHGESEHLG
jgi:hypothetical protein